MIEAYILKKLMWSLILCKDAPPSNIRLMICRMKRFPAERVEDEVEIELLKEQEVLKGVASLLERTVEQMSEQIR